MDFEINCASAQENFEKFVLKYRKLTSFFSFDDRSGGGPGPQGPPSYGPDEMISSDMMK